MDRPSPVTAFTLLVLALLVISILLPLASSTFPRTEVLHPRLRTLMAEAEPDTELEVILQFRPAMTDRDLAVAEALGVQVLRTYPAIHGFYGKGEPEALAALSRYAPVFWMEYNSQMEYYLQDTTRVVEAVQAWNSVVVSADGDPRQDEFGEFEYIDGSGVAVVVIDTGIDAGHPDFDYDEGKTFAYKFDGTTWYETENSDTTSGHGTHVGGTVAGNGDASAGARKGTAPGATLIGLGVGDLLFINFGLDAFQWVYEHSRPDDNPLNIRVATNSWGSSGAEYDPNNAIAQMVLALARDNNVVSIFAAGNSGGDGSDLRTNPYANIPLAISVAALEHDGSAIADFSSRGDKTKPQTWPDIGAPGVNIWATAPRDTIIDGAERTQNNGDIYYMSISGTSMATPHIAGIVALLYQAAPHLGLADYLYEDHETASGEWYTQEGTPRQDTLVTEAELILEITARYLAGAQEGANASGYPSGATTPHDWGQGHGLVDVNQAVALALTLEELRTRDENGDGRPDLGKVTLFEAYEVLTAVSTQEEFTARTDTLKANWKGEWAHFSDDEGDSRTDNTHYLFVPAGVTQAHIDLSYSPVSLERSHVANIDVTIDADGDGQNDDLLPTTTVQDHKHYELQVTPEMTARLWVFGLNGQAYGGKPLVGLAPEEYWEPLVRYGLGVRLFFGPGNHFIDENQANLADYDMDIRHYARLTQLELGTPSASYANTTLTLARTAYNLSRLSLGEPLPTEEEPPSGFGAVVDYLEGHPAVGAALALAIVGLLGVAVHLAGSPRLAGANREVDWGSPESGENPGPILEAEELPLQEDSGGERAK